MIWSYFVTYILCYVICQTPTWGGRGADCFHPKWAVASSYWWNLHCFQIWWRICHSVGIGIKGSSCNRVNAAMNPVSIVAGSSRQQTTNLHIWKKITCPVWEIIWLVKSSMRTTPASIYYAIAVNICNMENKLTIPLQANGIIYYTGYFYVVTSSCQFVVA